MVMPAEPATVRVNVVVPSAVEAAFRAEVFARKGMRKGNISEAITEAIRLWIDNQSPGPVPRAVAKRPPVSTSPSRKGPAATAVAARTRRGASESHQEIATAKMTPGERMELAYKLSRFTRS